MLIPALCREHVTPEMFFTTHALPSPTSAEGYPPLFGGSQVLRHGPTSPARACPHCGLWPSRTGLGPYTKACWRSPGSRACCFSACAGSLDYAGPDSRSRITRLPCCLPPPRNGVGILFFRLFEAQSPRPLMPPAYASRNTSRCPLQD